MSKSGQSVENCLLNMEIIHPFYKRLNDPLHTE